MSANSAPTDTGPWGPAADVLLSLLPVILLLFLTLKPRPMKTTRSLPLAALVMWLVRIVYFSSNPNQVNATVVKGLFDSLTPVAIVLGAITLFEVMELTGCLAGIIHGLKAVSAGNAVAEVFLIGWAFVYLIEGASGFGTPTALAAPMLVQLGHDVTRSVSLCLIMNTLPTVFGAAGTPIWFGFDGLGLSEEQLLQISWKSGVILLASVHVVPLLAATHLMSWATVRKNIVFIYLSIWSAALPAFVLSFFTTEFPALVGGVVGCVLTAVLVEYKIGLSEDEDDGPETSPRRAQHRHQRHSQPSRDGDAELVALEQVLPDERQDSPSTSAGTDMTRATSESPAAATVDGRLKMGRYQILLDTFPLWSTVLLLALTRVEEFGVKQYLQEAQPSLHAQLGSLATFYISPSLVIRLADIFREPGISWRFELLYVPFVLPFFVVSLCTMVLFKRRLPAGKGFWRHCSDVMRQAFRRIIPVMQALAGALVLVALLRHGGQGSPAYSIGYNLSELFQHAWIVFAPFLGALGAFFSGSTTVSNLTFGAVQKTAAENLGVSVTSMLAVQAIGAASGNMVCLNNIIAGKAVVGRGDQPEADYIALTYRPMIVFSVITAAVGSVLLYG